MRCKAVVLLGLLLLAVPLAMIASERPAASSEIVDQFVCKYSGRTVTFTEDGTQVLVRFRETATLAARDALARAKGLGRVHSSDNEWNVGVYRVTSGLTARRAAERLAASDLVFDARPLLVDNDGYPQYLVAGEMTVQFLPGVDRELAEGIIRDFGSQIVVRQRTPGYYTITVPAGMTEYEAIRAMNEMPLVWFAEESMLGFDDATFEPNDALYPNQWHHDNTGQTGGTIDADIRSEEAWDLVRGDPNVVMVIIDTGMDLDHPDLAGNLFPQGNEDWNFADGPSRSPEDTSGHGTATSGLAAAIGDNNIGGAGVCMDCRIIPLKINLASGANQNRADAINYAVQFQLDHPEIRMVLSNSWRMSSGQFGAVEAACQNAFDNDVPILFSSGNGNSSINFPAKYPTTLAIGASSPCDERKYPSSCDGENFWGSNFGPEQTVVSPGVLMTTTALGGGSTATFNGTSAACPVAAGVAGLILSVNPGLTYAEVTQILQDSADDEVGPPFQDPPGRDDQMGWGRVNAEAAVLLTPFPEPPSIFSVDPPNGIVNQSTSVTITGEGFFGGPQVTFGGVPAVFVNVTSPTELVAGTPVGTVLGPVDVTVSTLAGSDTLVDGFSYDPKLFVLGSGEFGTELIYDAVGLPNSDWGLVIDTDPGPRFKKGLLWDIGFRNFQILHDAFRTGDPPLSGIGQGRSRFTIDDPKLVGETLHAQAVFDGNGSEAGRALTLAPKVETPITD